MIDTENPIFTSSVTQKSKGYHKERRALLKIEHIYTYVYIYTLLIDNTLHLHSLIYSTESSYKLFHILEKLDIIDNYFTIINSNLELLNCKLNY